MSNRYQREASFLGKSPGDNSSPLGIGINKFMVVTPKDQGSEIVLGKAKSVLSIIDETAIIGAWPDDSTWVKRLPKWFVAACAPIMSEQQANMSLIKWKKLSPSDREKADEEEIWAIDNWVHWMRPDNRHWFWWDSAIVDENHFLVAVEVEAWPFPWGSLRWLLKAAGASKVESIE